MARRRHGLTRPGYTAHNDGAAATAAAAATAVQGWEARLAGVETDLRALEARVSAAPGDAHAGDATAVPAAVLDRLAASLRALRDEMVRPACTARKAHSPAHSNEWPACVCVVVRQTRQLDGELLRLDADRIGPRRAVPLCHVPSNARAALGGAVVDVAAGLADHALFSNGGRIMHTSAAFAAPTWTDLLFRTVTARESPSVMLRPSVHNGACWAMAGAQGWFEVRLPYAVVPTHISLDHVPKAAAVDPDRRSAPRQVRVRVPDHAGGWTDLASVAYDVNAAFHVQTFAVARVRGSRQPRRPP
jgi:hypothetical protein